MSGPVADLWPRGRSDDATNARLVSHQEGTLERYDRIWSRYRGSKRIKRYPQYHTVRGMYSELWRRRRRPISLFCRTARPNHRRTVPAASVLSVNQVLSRLCASARGYGDTRGTGWYHLTYTMLNMWASFLSPFATAFTAAKK